MASWKGRIKLHIYITRLSNKYLIKNRRRELRTSKQ